MSNEKRSLTPREMAAISAGVPMSGNKEIDAILSVGLRLRIATELLAGAVANPDTVSPSPAYALERADALLALFDSNKTGQ